MNIWHTGQINRWHTNPRLRNSGDSNDAHSNRMAKLALWLFPDDCDVNLLAEIVMHDAGESVTGDVPSHAKTGPLGSEVRARERHFREENGLIYSLSPRQWAILGFLDLLDAWLWAQQNSAYDKTWDDDLRKLRQQCKYFELPDNILHGVF